MAVTAEIIVLGLIGAIIWYLLGQRMPKNFPPGPWGFPILGGLPHLGRYPWKGLIRLKAKYGPIIGFYSMAGKRSIAISDYKLMKLASHDPAFSGRPNLDFMRDRSGGGAAEGIIHSEGRKWQEQKRFSLRKLRDFGFGTRSMEAIVHDEIKELIERLRVEVGKPISTQNRFSLAVINALWSIVAGERFSQEDPRVQEIFRLFTQDLSSFGLRIMATMMIPTIGKYAPDIISQYSKLIGPVDKMKALIEPCIDSHISTHIVNQPRDFIDSYIDEVKSTTDPSSSFHERNNKTFMYTLFDLFMAGGETTSTTLTWIFLHMACHPRVQDKLHEEIDRVVGGSRLPSLADRVNMPYMEAVIHEVLRMKPLVPVTMQRTVEDVQFQGYNLPADTLVFFNIYQAHYDVEVWGDPEVFRPERFLDGDGGRFVHREGFAVFSMGKRVCLGERLARDELFLFAGALFQAFTVGVHLRPPSLESTTFGVMLPRRGEMVVLGER